MHATGLWFTQYHAGFAVEAQFLENGCAIFPLWRYFTHTNFITNYFNWFLTFDNTTVEWNWRNAKQNEQKNWLEKSLSTIYDISFEWKRCNWFRTGDRMRQEQESAFYVLLKPTIVCIRHGKQSGHSIHVVNGKIKGIECSNGRITERWVRVLFTNVPAIGINRFGSNKIGAEQIFSFVQRISKYDDENKEKTVWIALLLVYYWRSK